MNLEDPKQRWKLEIPKDEIYYRVYYIDYGIDCTTYQTQLICSYPEAKEILEDRIANGVDVLGMVVEVQTLHKELLSNA